MLTGFMGTGKTTVGRLLAWRLNYAFVDTDKVVVLRDGRSIPQIFRQSGELVFRRLEAQVAEELAGGEGMVIATGGRLMLDARNAAVLSNNSFVFCLTASPEEIVSRVSPKDSIRPLLDVPDPLLRVRELLAERAVGYAQFPQIDTNGKRPVTVAEEIMERIRNDDR